MKRGFLNSKKAKDSLYRASSPTSVVVPLGDAQTSSHSSLLGPKTLSEPVVGHKMIRDISVKTLESYGVVRIPSLQLLQPKEPFATCMIRPSTCSKISSTPGFYTPPPPLNPTDVVLEKKTPNMGVGLFTKRDVKYHQIIFSERPLLIFPRGLPMDFTDLSEEEAIKKYDLLMEEALQQASTVMTKEDVDAYMKLSNCLSNRLPMHGIAGTNSFSVGDDIEEGNIQEGKPPYAVVARLASRINHNCTQNVTVKFDIPTFSLQVAAIRDIKAGEQLFYCYCQPNRDVKERRRQLATYGFECQCKACVYATPESNKLREEISDRIQKIVDGKEAMFANPEFSIRSLDPLLRLEREIVEEGLDFGEKFIDLIYAILQGYVKLGNRSKHIEYYNKGKRLTAEFAYLNL